MKYPSRDGTLENNRRTLVLGTASTPLVRQPFCPNIESSSKRTKVPVKGKLTLTRQTYSGKLMFVISMLFALLDQTGASVYPPQAPGSGIPPNEAPGTAPSSTQTNAVAGTQAPMTHVVGSAAPPAQQGSLPILIEALVHQRHLIPEAERNTNVTTICTLLSALLALELKDTQELLKRPEQRAMLAERFAERNLQTTLALLCVTIFRDLNITRHTCIDTFLASKPFLPDQWDDADLPANSHYIYSFIIDHESSALVMDGGYCYTFDTHAHYAHDTDYSGMRKFKTFREGIMKLLNNRSPNACDVDRVGVDELRTWKGNPVLNHQPRTNLSRDHKAFFDCAFSKALYKIIHNDFGGPNEMMQIQTFTTRMGVSLRDAARERLRIQYVVHQEEKQAQNNDRLAAYRASNPFSTGSFEFVAARYDPNPNSFIPVEHFPTWREIFKKYKLWAGIKTHQGADYVLEPIKAVPTASSPANLTLVALLDEYKVRDYGALTDHAVARPDPDRTPPQSGSPPSQNVNDPVAMATAQSVQMERMRLEQQRQLEQVMAISAQQARAGGQPSTGDVPSRNDPVSSPSTNRSGQSQRSGSELDPRAEAVIRQMEQKYDTDFNDNMAQAMAESESQKPGSTQPTERESTVDDAALAKRMQDEEVIRANDRANAQNPRTEPRQRGQRRSENQTTAPEGQSNAEKAVRSLEKQDNDAMKEAIRLSHEEEKRANRANIPPEQPNSQSDPRQRERRSEQSRSENQNTAPDGPSDAEKAARSWRKQDEGAMEEAIRLSREEEKRSNARNVRKQESGRSQTQSVSNPKQTIVEEGRSDSKAQDLSNEQADAELRERMKMIQDQSRDYRDSESEGSDERDILQETEDSQNDMVTIDISIDDSMQRPDPVVASVDSSPSRPEPSRPRSNSTSSKASSTKSVQRQDSHTSESEEKFTKKMWKAIKAQNPEQATSSKKPSQSSTRPTTSKTSQTNTGNQGITTPPLSKEDYRIDRKVRKDLERKQRKWKGDLPDFIKNQQKALKVEAKTLAGKELPEQKAVKAHAARQRILEQNIQWMKEVAAKKRMIDGEKEGLTDSEIAIMKSNEMQMGHAEADRQNDEMLKEALAKSLAAA